MKSVYTLKFPMIAIFVSFWISLALTQFYEIVETGSNRKTHCYLAKGPDPLAVKVKMGLPKALPYLHMATKFNITLANEEGTFYSTSTTYDLFLHQKECKNNFFISSKGLAFQTAVLIVEFFTSPNFGLLSRSLHVFPGRFNDGVSKLKDTTGFIEFQAEMKKSGNLFLPESSNMKMKDIVDSLAKITANGDCLCLIGLNKQRVLLKTLSYEKSLPNRHIAAIAYRYKLPNVHPEWTVAIIPAFGCGCEQASVLEDAKFIYEHSEPFTGTFEALYVGYPPPFHCQHGKPEDATVLHVQPTLAVHMRELGTLSWDVKKIFLIHTTLKKTQCAKDHIRYIHATREGKNLFAFELFERSVGNIKAFDWIPTISPDCPKIQ